MQAANEKLEHAARLSLAIVDMQLHTPHQPSRDQLSECRTALEDALLTAGGHTSPHDNK